MEHDEVDDALMRLLVAIDHNKPNDRSVRDRHFAILKTEAEKLYAYYRVWCFPDESEPEE